MNKPGSIIAAVAGIAVLSGFGLTHHHTATATHTATAAASTVHQVSHTPTATAAHAAAHPAAADPSLVWLASARGQAQEGYAKPRLIPLWDFAPKISKNPVTRRVK